MKFPMQSYCKIKTFWDSNGSHLDLNSLKVQTCIKVALKQFKNYIITKMYQYDLDTSLKLLTIVLKSIGIVECILVLKIPSAHIFSALLIIRYTLKTYVGTYRLNQQTPHLFKVMTCYLQLALIAYTFRKL